MRQILANKLQTLINKEKSHKERKMTHTHTRTHNKTSNIFKKIVTKADEFITTKILPN
jgi:hypothetical protein